MPQVTDNPDGTKTLSINSEELRALRSLLLDRVPDVKKVVRAIESPQFKASVEFLKAVIV
ncbi:hypothetical protein AB0M46_18670 [Dactylosporangium sp. NPDC051485]|uniref:hypothetical protein n=1 Tax=Dactylosporangium sp. NPDC051485 TaxID=3154846 RepID=UPI00342F3DC1